MKKTYDVINKYFYKKYISATVCKVSEEYTHAVDNRRVQ